MSKIPLHCNRVLREHYPRKVAWNLAKCCQKSHSTVPEFHMNSTPERWPAPWVNVVKYPPEIHPVAHRVIKIGLHQNWRQHIDLESTPLARQVLPLVDPLVGGVIRDSPGHLGEPNVTQMSLKKHLGFSVGHRHVSYMNQCWWLLFWGTGSVVSMVLWLQWIGIFYKIYPGWRPLCGFW